MRTSSKNEEKIDLFPVESTQEDDKVSSSLKPNLSKNQVLFSKMKRKILKHVILIRVLVLASIFFCALGVIWGIFSQIKKTEGGLYINLFSDFVFAPKDKIKAVGDRTNILVLGKGGQGHEAPDLTDTIMFISVNHKTSEVTIVSLPRDIWIPALRTKLNSIYYWGNQKAAGGGLVLAKTTVEEIVGQPVSYGVVIDFSGFKKIVDALGGIEVDVETSFADHKYPIQGSENDLCDGDREFKCRFETIAFEKGLQYMDGETALKFVRSRNAQGDEGTDFARAKRQQKVIKGIELKVLSREIILNPQKLFELKDVALSYIETDLTSSSAAILARRVFDGRDKIRSVILDENLLVNPPKSPRYDNLYVFIPKGNGWDEIHNWVLCKIEGCD